MKKKITILFIYIHILLLISCSVNQRTSEIKIIGYEKYNFKTVTIIDNLSRDRIPYILKKYYYTSLSDSDYFKPQMEISKNGDRILTLDSKLAKDGYKYINSLTKEYIDKHTNLIYTVNMDTVNSKEKIIRLVSLKRSNILKVDTLGTNDLFEIRVMIR